MFTRTRTIKGRQYLYAEWRWREGGKVRSRSRIIGRIGDFIAANIKVENDFGESSAMRAYAKQAAAEGAKKGAAEAAPPTQSSSAPAAPPSDQPPAGETEAEASLR